MLLLGALGQIEWIAGSRKILLATTLNQRSETGGWR
jgi:hypothetical protein